MLDKLNEIIYLLLKNNLISIEKIELIQSDINKNSAFYTRYWVETLTPVYSALID